MAKLVYVTHSRVHPPETGGQQRTFRLASGLTAAGYEVTLLALAGRRTDYRPRPGSFIETELADGLREVIDLRWPQGLTQAVINQLGDGKMWTLLTPLTRLSDRSSSILDSADAVIYDYPFHFLPESDTPRFMVSFNFEAELYRQGGWLDRRLLAPVAERMERRAVGTFDHVFSVAPTDTSFFRRFGPNVTEIPNGMGRLDFTSAERVAAREALGMAPDELVGIFVASSHPPNVEALADLRSLIARYEEVMDECNFRAIVIGSVAPEPFDDGRVQGLGFVEDVEPYLIAADVALNPVARGSGSNVKIFEAIGAAKPVLSTPFGLRGLPAETGPGIYRYETEAEFIAHLRAISAHRPQLEQIGAELRERSAESVLMDRIVADRMAPVIDSFLSGP